VQSIVSIAPPAAPRSFEGHCYRIALMLCPPVFRREHGDDMSRDFDDLRGEAEAHGSHALWTLRLAMTIDLIRTLVVQWLRTGLPAIALVAASVQLAIAVGLAAFARLATIAMPRSDRHVTQADAEVMVILLMGITSLLLIVMTIALNVWVTRLNRRRRLR
jgi:cytochrome bd-type quinol oxidase subunit 2